MKIRMDSKTSASAERRQRRQAEADRIQAEIRADAQRLGLPLLEDDR